MTERTERINSLIREELSTLVREELHDPRVAGLVTIMQIDTSPDLRHAIAFVSVLGTDAERDSTMRALQHARPFLRRELARRMTSKNTPDLDFRLDTSMERAQELTEIMRRNAAERGEKL
jgi:ribosome-binding factor A